MADPNYSGYAQEQWQNTTRRWQQAGSPRQGAQASDIFSRYGTQPILAAGLQGRHGVTPQDMAGALTTRGPGTDIDVFSRQANEALYSGVLEASRLRDEEDRRLTQATDRLRTATDRNTRPSMTADDINSLFAREADRITQGHLQNMDFLRQSAGVSGVRGAAQADMGLQAELARLGQLTGAKRDLFIAKVESDAQDSVRNLSAELNLANFSAQSPSLLLLDQLNSMAGVRLTQQGLAMGAQQARDAATASKQAGLMGLGGQLAGAAIGAFA